MRLDFNNDGSVSVDDLRKGVTQLYEFLKNYDYIEATTRIKSQIYEEAQKYIKANQAARQSDEPDPDDIPFVAPAFSPVKVVNQTQIPLKEETVYSFG